MEHSVSHVVENEELVVEASVLYNIKNVESEVKTNVKKLPNTGSSDSGMLLGLGTIFTGLILRRKVKENK